MQSLPTLFADGTVVFSAVPWHQYDQWRLPGVYMLCRRDESGIRTILYIGEAENIAERLGFSHEHWSEALLLGMNEVHVHLLAITATERRAVETRLRRRYPTPLNRQSPAQQKRGLLSEAFAWTDAGPTGPRPRLAGGLLTGLR